MHEFFKTFVRQTGLRTGASLCYPPCCLGLELILARSPLLNGLLSLLIIWGIAWSRNTHNLHTYRGKKKRLRLRAVPPFRRSPLRESKEKIAQIKIDVSKPLGKVTLEKYFSCPSLLEFRTVCFHQFVFPLVFFFNSRDRLRKKAGTVRCLLGNIFRLGTARAPEDFFFFWGGGDLMDFRGNVGG